jgi:hypothetical protein
MALLSPEPVWAQSPGTAVVYGLGGMTFGAPAGGAIAAGVRVKFSWLEPSAEIGWLNRLPTGHLHEEGDVLSDNTGLKLTSAYALFGARFVFPGSRIAPFAEGALGLARWTIEVRPLASGSADAIRSAEPVHETDPATAVGAGLRMRFSPRIGADVGYRHTWVRGDDPFTVRAVYGAFTVTF